MTSACYTYINLYDILASKRSSNQRIKTYTHHIVNKEKKSQKRILYEKLINLSY